MKLHSTSVMLVAGLMLAAAGTQTVCAQESVEVVTSETNTLPIKGAYESTNGIYNFKTFEVEAADAGDHYAEFWLRPAKHANDQYTSFYVYVNRAYVGEITPTTGNWQSARIEGIEAFSLMEGSNVITIATRAPEFPDVETIRVARNETDAELSSDAFDAYLDDAIAGTVRDEVPTEDEGIATFANGQAAGVAFFTNIPLNYSFYSSFFFTKGQEIFITTSSETEHFIDVMYRTTDKSRWVVSVSPDRSAKSNIRPPTTLDSVFIKDPPARDSLNFDSVYMIYKLNEQYELATSEEMQGLNWKGISAPAKNSTKQVATVRFTVPKSGKYLVRLRSKKNGVLSVADLNVNGEYYYENAPIYFAGVSCVIPADGYTYASMTNCSVPGTDDPLIFIHGADSDKLVGFNDDGPSDKIKQYNLSGWDAYIAQKYLVKTTGISVSNYSSSKPVSKCDILARVVEDAPQPTALKTPKSRDVSESSSIPIADNSVSIPGMVGLDATLTITATDNINRISVFGLAGHRLGSIESGSPSISVPVSELNILQRGIYIVSVETATGVTSQKVVIK